VCGSVVRAYGVRTGELVTEYEKLKGKIIGVELHPINPDVIVACSENGELIQWNCNSRLPSSVMVSYRKLRICWYTVASLQRFAC
jgi:hypothetical protein